jgi:hypothetical protein
MEYFSGGKVGELIALRLDYGDDVQECVERAARELEIHTGAVISGIGTLFKARLHSITTTTFPGKDEFWELEGPIEVASISGLIADHVPHLHTVLAIGKTSYAGHLEPGCKVLYLAELALVRFEGLPLTRIVEPKTGVKQLKRVQP